MGCFLGCFGGEKNHKRRKPRIKRTRPQIQRKRVQDVHHETVSTAEEAITEAPTNTSVAEFRNKPVEEEKMSASPRKKVAFSSNNTIYEHALVSRSIESLVECGIENHSDLERKSPIHSLVEANNSDVSTVGSFPPNHRYHNARESDDEADVYGDSDLDNFDDDYNDYEPVLASSNESKREEESLTALKIQSLDAPRDKSDHIDQLKGVVDASLSNWLDSPETMIKKIRSSGLDDYTSLKNFEDRPILGALTVEELRRISATSTPRKSSPSRSPDEIPIIGTVGTFWNHSESASPYRGLPNTTNKYTEDTGVDWHSTPFETRLDRALDHATSEG